jgi:hypothetical protein
MIFRPGERRQSETSAITMRPGWLAQAAFVFHPLIPKIVPRVPHPSAHPAEGWDSTVPTLLGFSWYAPDFEELQGKCPVCPVSVPTTKTRALRGSY